MNSPKRKLPVWLDLPMAVAAVLTVLFYVVVNQSVFNGSIIHRYTTEHIVEYVVVTFFICWVAPVLGILGTVIHFASAFVGMAPDQVTDNLQKIMGEIGTAFSTTTVALAAAITMMFSLFLCERTERSIVQAINRQVDNEL